MKIKSVCELTELTDRTIRYYIEEGLIAPAYTQSYMGRKNFEFCEADVSALKTIALLRRFDFSVAEIRTMQEQPVEIVPTVRRMAQRKQDIIEEQEQLFLLLSKVDSARSWTVDELAEILSDSAKQIRPPIKTESCFIQERNGQWGNRVWNALITGLPVVGLFMAMVMDWSRFAYSKGSFARMLLSLRYLLPSMLLLYLPKLRWRERTKRICRNILWGLCMLAVLAIPLDLFMGNLMVMCSETEYVGNYRLLDASCPLQCNEMFQELFPINPSWGDIKDYYYQYRKGWEWSCDVYAELKLDAAGYWSELERVRTLFVTFKGTGTYEIKPLHTERFEGLVLYGSDVPWEKVEAPFQTVEGNYEYFIFAYDTRNEVARYICCVSLENGIHQPYYLRCDW